MEPTQKNSSSWGELIRFVIIAALIIVPIRVFIAQPFIVSGASMNPTFQDADYLIVDELSYYLRQPTRGEVIVFRPPHNQKTFYIKRVIGLPGETITIQNGAVSITTTNTEAFVLDESYINVTTMPNLEKTLGADEYFVMGDNRNNSTDSRSWGALPGKLIRGRALLRILPLSEFGLLPGKVAN